MVVTCVKMSPTSAGNVVGPIPIALIFATLFNVIDEFTHECVAIRVARKLKAIDVIDVLSET